ncbi:ADP-ribosylation/Crystallin J1 [Candidatus Omnitrophus magneticus]|uniref:ADP-ribosylation/Crystallin J1 n=1 Tax=Candidatus Omnitrophus magneticus TaxID=1609969 RepID=A0A0F0CQF5_9BACT|nr:ADP-ribosylation/Crystallin J1 [Candidatus Omnitrophus magneticus]
MSKLNFKINFLYAMVMRFFFKGMVCLLALCLQCEEIAFSLAEDNPSTFTLAGNDFSSSDSRLAAVDIFKKNDFLRIPRVLGCIEKNIKGNNGKTIIHIKDAHCDYSAQKTIGEIIERLNKKYGITLIFAEGGAGAYDFTNFTRIYDRETRQEVSDYFMRAGEITGFESYAINYPGRIHVYGAEDAELYLKSFHVARAGINSLEECRGIIQKLEKVLNDCAVKVYSSSASRFFLLEQEYAKSGMDFKKYCLALKEQALSARIDITRYNNFFNFTDLILIEAPIDFARAAKERELLLSELKEIFVPSETENLARLIFDYNDGLINETAIYSYLLSKASRRLRNVERFSMLYAYTAYLEKSETINTNKLMSEIAALKKIVTKKIFIREDEKYVANLKEEIKTVKAMMEFSLTESEFKSYSFRKKSLNFLEIIKPLNDICARNKIKFIFQNEDARRLTRQMRIMETFYRSSFKRDLAFVKNIEKKFREDNSDTALFISGGFHSGNLERLFRKNGYSYVSLTPVFKNIDTRSDYLNILNGRTSELETVVKVNTASLLPATRFSQFSKIVWGKDSTNIFNYAASLMALMLSTPSREIILETSAKEKIKIKLETASGDKKKSIHCELLKTDEERNPAVINSLNIGDKGTRGIIERASSDFFEKIDDAVLKDAKEFLDNNGLGDISDEIVKMAKIKHPDFDCNILTFVKFPFNYAGEEGLYVYSGVSYQEKRVNFLRVILKAYFGHLEKVSQLEIDRFIEGYGKKDIFNITNFRLCLEERLAKIIEKGYLWPTQDDVKKFSSSKDKEDLKIKRVYKAKLSAVLKVSSIEKQLERLRLFYAENATAAISGVFDILSKRRKKIFLKMSKRRILEPEKIQEKQKELDLIFQEKDTSLQYLFLIFSFCKNPEEYLRAMEERTYLCSKEQSWENTSYLIELLYNELFEAIVRKYFLRGDVDAKINVVLSEMFYKQMAIVYEEFSKRIYDTHTTSLDNLFSIIDEGFLYSINTQKERGVLVKDFPFNDSLWAGTLGVFTNMGFSIPGHGDVIFDLSNEWIDRHKGVYYFPGDAPYGIPKNRNELEVISLSEKLETVMSREDAEIYLAAKITAQSFKDAFMDENLTFRDAGGLEILERNILNYFNKQSDFFTIKSYGLPEGHIYNKIPIKEGVQFIHVPADKLKEIDEKLDYRIEESIVRDISKYIGASLAKSIEEKGEYPRFVVYTSPDKTVKITFYRTEDRMDIRVSGKIEISLEIKTTIKDDGKRFISITSASTDSSVKIYRMIMKNTRRFIDYKKKMRGYTHTAKQFTVSPRKLFYLRDFFPVNRPWDLRDKFLFSIEKSSNVHKVKDSEGNIKFFINIKNIDLIGLKNFLNSEYPSMGIEIKDGVMFVPYNSIKNKFLENNFYGRVLYLTSKYMASQEAFISAAGDMFDMNNNNKFMDIGFSSIEAEYAVDNGLIFEKTVDKLAAMDAFPLIFPYFDMTEKVIQRLKNLKRVIQYGYKGNDSLLIIASFLAANAPEKEQDKIFKFFGKEIKQKDKGKVDEFVSYMRDVSPSFDNEILFKKKATKNLSLEKRESSLKHILSLDNVNKVIAVSDIHAEISALEEVLHSAGVINDKNEWVLEKGSALIIAGDFIDKKFAGEIHRDKDIDGRKVLEKYADVIKVFKTETKRMKLDERFKQEIETVLNSTETGGGGQALGDKRRAFVGALLSMRTVEFLRKLEDSASRKGAKVIILYGDSELEILSGDMKTRTLQKIYLLKLLGVGGWYEGDKEKDGAEKMICSPNKEMKNLILDAGRSRRSQNDFLQWFISRTFACKINNFFFIHGGPNRKFLEKLQEREKNISGLSFFNEMIERAFNNNGFKDELFKEGKTNISPFSSSGTKNDFAHKSVDISECFLEEVKADFLVVGHNAFLDFQVGKRIEKEDDEKYGLSRYISRISRNRNIIKLDTNTSHGFPISALVIDWEKGGLKAESTFPSESRSLLINGETLNEPVVTVDRMLKEKELYKQISDKYEVLTNSPRKIFFIKVTDLLASYDKDTENKCKAFLGNAVGLVKKITSEDIKKFNISDEDITKILSLYEEYVSSIAPSGENDVNIANGYKETRTFPRPPPENTSTGSLNRTYSEEECLSILGDVKKREKLLWDREEWVNDYILKMLSKERNLLYLELDKSIKRYLSESPVVFNGKEENFIILSERIKRIDTYSLLRKRLSAGVSAKGFNEDEGFELGDMSLDMGTLLNIMPEGSKIILTGLLPDGWKKYAQEQNSLIDNEGVIEIERQNKKIIILNPIVSERIDTTTSAAFNLIKKFNDIDFSEYLYIYTKPTVDVITSKYVINNSRQNNTKQGILKEHILTSIAEYSIFYKIRKEFVNKYPQYPEENIRKVAYALNEMIYEKYSLQGILHIFPHFFNPDKEPGISYCNKWEEYVNNAYLIAKKCNHEILGRVIIFETSFVADLHRAGILEAIQQLGLENNEIMKCKIALKIVDVNSNEQINNIEVIIIPGIEDDCRIDLQKIVIILNEHEMEKRKENFKKLLDGLSIQKKEDIAIAMAEDEGDIWGISKKGIIALRKKYTMLTKKEIAKVINTALEEQSKKLETMIKAVEFSDNKDDRARAAIELGNYNNDLSIKALIKSLNNDSSSNVRKNAAQSLGKIKAIEATSVLIDALYDNNRQVRWVSAVSLSRIPRAVIIDDYLKKVLSSNDFEQWSYAAVIWRNNNYYIQDSMIRFSILTRLHEKDLNKFIRVLCIDFLKLSGGQLNFDQIKPYRKNKDISIREKDTSVINQIQKDTVFTRESSFPHKSQLKNIDELTGDIQSKFIGSLLGLAAGDALGAPVEGMDAGSIKEVVGKISGYFRYKYRNAGEYTDDTEMALFISESLKEFGEINPEVLSKKIGRHVYEIDAGFRKNKGFSLETLMAGRSLYAGFHWRDANKFRTGVYSDKETAPGAGAGMRIAPLGLFFYDDLEALKKNAVTSAMITHNDKDSIAMAVAVAYLAARLVTIKKDFNENVLLEDTADFVEDISKDISVAIRETAGVLSKDSFIFCKPHGPREVLQAALRAFLKNKNNFEQTIIEAVYMGGDTDTIAAIAGALSGAYNGIQAIPYRFISGLSDNEEIQKQAEALYMTKLQTFVKTKKREGVEITKDETDVNEPDKNFANTLKDIFKRLSIDFSNVEPYKIFIISEEPFLGGKNSEDDNLFIKKHIMKIRNFTRSLLNKLNFNNIEISYCFGILEAKDAVRELYGAGMTGKKNIHFLISEAILNKLESDKEFKNIIGNGDKTIKEVIAKKAIMDVFLDMTSFDAGRLIPYSKAILFSFARLYLASLGEKYNFKEDKDLYLFALELLSKSLINFTGETKMDEDVNKIFEDIKNTGDFASLIARIFLINLPASDVKNIGEFKKYIEREIQVLRSV